MTTTVVVRDGKPVLKVGSASEKGQFKELLERNRLKIEVDEEERNEKCPFDPEKEYEKSFCGFVDQWLRNEVPGTQVSRIDALMSVKIAKDEVSEKEEKKERK